MKLNTHLACAILASTSAAYVIPLENQDQIKHAARADGVIPVAPMHKRAEFNTVASVVSFQGGTGNAAQEAAAADPVGDTTVVVTVAATTAAAAVQATQANTQAAVVTQQAGTRPSLFDLLLGIGSGSNAAAAAPAAAADDDDSTTTVYVTTTAPYPAQQTLQTVTTQAATTAAAAAVATAAATQAATSSSSSGFSLGSFLSNLFGLGSGTTTSTTSSGTASQASSGLSGTASIGLSIGASTSSAGSWSQSSSSSSSSSGSSGSSNLSGGAAAAVGSKGMTYSPYTKSNQCKTASEVASDIAKLKDFEVIRLYSTDCNGIENVLAAMTSSQKLFLGVWNIDSASVQSGLSAIKSALSTSSRGWNAVDTISIGNERVNEGAASVQDIANAVSTARSWLKSNAPQYTGPVVSVDTLVAVVANPGLCQISDYLAVNSHPYWDGNVQPSNSGPWLKQQIANLQSACGSSKKIVITETGWPTKGQTYGSCVPSEANQIAAMKSIVSSLGSQVLAFTMYNDYWKSGGPYGVEQYWGLFGDPDA